MRNSRWPPTDHSCYNSGSRADKALMFVYCLGPDFQGQGVYFRHLRSCKSSTFKDFSDVTSLFTEKCTTPLYFSLPLPSPLLFPSPPKSSEGVWGALWAPQGFSRNWILCILNEKSSIWWEWFWWHSRSTIFTKFGTNTETDRVLHYVNPQMSVGDSFPFSQIGRKLRAPIFQFLCPHVL